MSAAVSSSRIEHRFSRKHQPELNSSADVLSRRQYLSDKTLSAERDDHYHSKKNKRELGAGHGGGGRISAVKGLLGTNTDPAVQPAANKNSQISAPHLSPPRVHLTGKVTVDTALNQPIRQYPRSKVSVNSLGLLDKDPCDTAAGVDIAEHTFGTPTETPCSSFGASIGTPYGSYGDISPVSSTAGGPNQLTASGTFKSPGGHKFAADRGDMRRGEYGRNVAWGPGDDSSGRGGSDLDSRYNMLGPSTPSSRRSERSESTISEFFDAIDAPFSEASTSDDEGFGSARSLARRQERELVMARQQLEESVQTAAVEPLPAVKTPKVNGEVQRITPIVQDNPPSLATSSAGGVAEVEEEAQEIVVARTVATAVALGVARGEMEAASRSEMERKNTEIARLRDKLQYWERVNHEMAQARELAIEQTRQKRRARQRLQWWIAGGSLGLTVAVAALGVGIYALGQSLNWELGTILAKLQESASLDAGGNETATVELKETIEALSQESNGL